MRSLRMLAPVALLSALLALPALASDGDLGPRRAAARSVGLRIGGAFPMNRADGDDTRGLPGLGVFWLYDAGNFLADISLDGFYTKGDSLAQLGIGAYFPLTTDDIAPYLGAGVGWAWIDTGDGATGISVRGAGGLLVGRRSSVQVRVEAGWLFMTFAERADGQPARSPNAPFVWAGIAF